MENTTQAIAALEAAIKNAQDAISQLKSVNEPKDGEWYELERDDNVKFLIKAKSKVGRDGNEVNYHILIEDNGDLLIDDWCAWFETARKITPEEALPYFKKYFEKQGFKEGVKYNSAASGGVFTLACVRASKVYEWCFYGGISSILFDNDTNTFATLVEEKVEPLDMQGAKVIAYKNKVVIYFEDDDVAFTHSEIEQIYKLSLKAQGK